MTAFSPWALAADKVEHGQTTVVGDDGLPVDQERTSRQRCDRRDDQRKARCEIAALAGD
jgi:hypothetical protein